MPKQNKKINESLLFIRIRIGLFFFIQYTQGKYFVDDSKLLIDKNVLSNCVEIELLEKK